MQFYGTFIQNHQQKLRLTTHWCCIFATSEENFSSITWEKTFFAWAQFCFCLLRVIKKLLSTIFFRICWNFMAHSKTKKIEFLDQNVIFKKKVIPSFFLRRIDKTNVTVTPFYWKNPLVEDFSFRRKNMFALLKLWKAVEKKLTAYCQSLLPSLNGSSLKLIHHQNGLLNIPVRDHIVGLCCYDGLDKARNHSVWLSKFNMPWFKVS